MSDDICCPDIIEAKAGIADHERRISGLESDFATFVKEIRDAMTYRLPLWATCALSGLCGVVGWLLASR